MLDIAFLLDIALFGHCIMLDFALCRTFGHCFVLTFHLALCWTLFSVGHCFVLDLALCTTCFLSKSVSFVLVIHLRDILQSLNCTVKLEHATLLARCILYT